MLFILLDFVHQFQSFIILFQLGLSMINDEFWILKSNGSD